MRVVDYQKLIKESETELKVLEKQQSNARLRLRLQMLRLLKSGQFSQIKQVSQFCGFSPKHGYDLWKKYREMGLAEYLQLKYQACQSRLAATEQSKLLKRAEKGFASQRQAQEYIEQEFGISYTQQGISKMFERLQVKAKVPRPFNIKADGVAQSEYKKTFL